MHELAVMAPRATRSASRKTRLTEAVATGPLGALSHDELGVIFDGLADPLQPVVAVALSSTCLGLRTPLRAALEVLQQQHMKTQAFIKKMDISCADMRVAEKLKWGRDAEASPECTVEDMATLGMILRTCGLPRLQSLELYSHGFGDAGVLSLCEGLGDSSAPSLRLLNLSNNDFGPAGAEALAAALGRGALPKLKDVRFATTGLGRSGLAALLPALRALPGLKRLNLFNCAICDEAVALLAANLGKDDFKALQELVLDGNQLTDMGCATLASALDQAGLPALKDMSVSDNFIGEVPSALVDAAARRGIKVFPMEDDSDEDDYELYGDDLGDDE